MTAGSSWRGGRVTPRAVAVLAPNPSPTTLEGTNTWVLAEPGDGTCLVVDPGPADAAHLAAVREEVAGREVAAVLLTHHHLDHAEGARASAASVGAPVRSVVEGVGGPALTDGEVVTAGALAVEVLATPGHTADSLCLLLRTDRALLTGDTILGRGTTTVSWPEGRLGDYLDSLARLADLTATGEVTTILPGHGPALTDAGAVVARYRRHREGRLAQVRQAVASGADDVEAVLRLVYADTPETLWPAARLSIRAQLDHLRVG